MRNSKQNTQSFYFQGKESVINSIVVSDKSIIITANNNKFHRDRLKSLYSISTEIKRVGTISERVDIISWEDSDDRSPPEDIFLHDTQISYDESTGQLKFFPSETPVRVLPMLFRTLKCKHKATIHDDMIFIEDTYYATYEVDKYGHFTNIEKYDPFLTPEQEEEIRSHYNIESSKYKITYQKDNENNLVYFPMKHSPRNLPNFSGNSHNNVASAIKSIDINGKCITIQPNPNVYHNNKIHSLYEVAKKIKREGVDIISLGYGNDDSPPEDIFLHDTQISYDESTGQLKFFVSENPASLLPMLLRTLQRKHYDTISGGKKFIRNICYATYEVDKYANFTNIEKYDPFLTPEQEKETLAIFGINGDCENARIKQNNNHCFQVFFPMALSLREFCNTRKKADKSSKTYLKEEELENTGKSEKSSLKSNSEYLIRSDESDITKAIEESLKIKQEKSEPGYITGSFESDMAKAINASCAENKPKQVSSFKLQNNFFAQGGPSSSSPECVSGNETKSLPSIRVTI